MGESVFVRGGLAYGDLFHEEDVCFGPALLEASQLEKDAIHPRISVSSDIINYKSDKFPYKAHLNQLETNQKIRRTFEYYQREVLSTDLTGEVPIHFIDYLWRYLPMSEEAAHAIKETVLFNLNQNYKDSVMAKYVWFATWFNSILGSYTSFSMEGIDISIKPRCEMPDYLLP
ncbi:hypothetical protein LJC07_04220 [Christensenellaceae bacterium OttesenSCG-928-L17]|nr:hypothetical protein [Christensenellaceae bacterium OttesenSCG-928-L17]